MTFAPSFEWTIFKRVFSSTKKHDIKSPHEDRSKYSDFDTSEFSGEKYLLVLILYLNFKTISDVPKLALSCTI